MADLFYDRFTRNVFSQPDSQHTLVGRWLIVPSPHEEVFLNSVPVSSKDFLVPEATGTWRLLDQDGEVFRGAVLRGQLPEDTEAESIRTIGEHLGGLINHSASWIEWLEVVPLVPGMSEDVELLPLDRKIREHFGHLEAVCLKPRAHLHVEVERVSISKARRLPVKATSYLASHTEDWERPLIKSVLPKRILSEVRQDQIDIYENRVAARLIDHVSVYLAHRIHKVQKLLKIFQDKEDYSKAIGGTYLRQRRILALWGQSIDTNEGRRKAEATLKELQWLKYKVMGLMDSPLYREVPRRSYVAPTLRTTNILANDQHYRRVAELWRDWAGSGHARTKSPLDIYREAQELCLGLDRFAFLLVTRALDQLGYLPIETDLEKPIKPSGRWTLEGHRTRVECIWRGDGNIRVESSGKSITFTSISVDLGEAKNEEQIQVVTDSVVDAAASSDGRLVALYLSSSTEQRTGITPATYHRLYTVGNNPRTHLPSTVGILPISPWDIGSVERIARGLRWFLDSTRFSSYPVIIDVEREVRQSWQNAASGNWLQASSGNNQLSMRRPPADFEWDRIGLEHLVEDARSNLAQANSEHERLSHELREAVRRGATGTINQQKKAAYERCDDAQRQLTALERLQRDLQEARKRTEALLVCPGCGKIADPRSFKARDRGCFRCDCQECRTYWATRLCGNGHKYAVMLPGDFIDTEDTSPGWEDRTYGSDLLALPARNSNGRWGFVCPDCGEVT